MGEKMLESMTTSIQFAGKVSLLNNSGWAWWGEVRVLIPRSSHVINFS